MTIWTVHVVFGLILQILVLGTPCAAVPRGDADPFDRAGCERFILSPDGRDFLAERREWLERYSPLTFKVSNGRVPPFPFEEIDPHFVEHQTKDLSSDIRAELRKDAWDFYRAHHRKGVVESEPSTPLTALQAAALGAGASPAVPATRLISYLFARSDGRWVLETHLGARRIGVVEFAKDELRIGYHWDPAYWIYIERQRRAADRRALTISNFLDDRGVVVFTPASAKHPVVFTLRLHGSTEADPDDVDVTMEIHGVRAVSAGVIAGASWRIPPWRDKDGRSPRLTSVGLTLNRIDPALPSPPGLGGI